MKHIKASKFFTATTLFLSFTSIALANQTIPSKEIAAVLEGVSAEDRLGLEKEIAGYAASILKVSPLQAIAQKQIRPQDILDLTQLSTQPEEMKALFSWADMIKKNTLRRNVILLIDKLKNSPTSTGAQIKATPQVYIDYAVDTIVASIEAVVKMRGLTSDSKHNSYTEWQQLSEKMINKLDKSAKGMENVLAFSNSNWLKTEKAEFLIDGPESFAKRELLMWQAMESINILTWSVYDDMTGTELADLLIQKKNVNKKVKIRIIVDGQVALQAGRNAQLDRMEKAGIEIVRWFSAKDSFMGQHRKMIIVDNKHLVAGGLNYGDVYSHKNPKTAHWRDTDIYLKGAGAEEGNQLFAKIWNDQLNEQKNLKFSKMKIANLRTDQDKNGIEVSVMDHDPRNITAGSTIMMTVLKSIREARSTIDIQNAYIILFPALKSEIQKAIQERNVKVRILTNSGTSVDEPIVSMPILRSVLEFVNMGAEVFVKKGDTLHSKLIVVDSEFSMIMSYNLHPRSERVEGEMAVAVRDQQFSRDLLNVFEQDVSEEKAQRILRAEDIQMPTSPANIPTLRVFFDML